MEKTDITVVGAGVIGLAVAAELSKTHKNIFVLERNISFGRETSSRNSEVIHAGIYYPPYSLKAKACVEGRGLLYEFCSSCDIPFRKTGKLIVATSQEEVKGLQSLFEQGRENGVRDLEIIAAKEVKKLEPHVNALAAIYSPSTGILDSHALMEGLVLQFKARGGLIAYGTELTGIDKAGPGYKVTVNDSSRQQFEFQTGVLINCAGLSSDKVSAMAGVSRPEYKLKYCKGDYFRVGNRPGYLSRLIYPVPVKKGAGLGIHATLDLAGSLRLGPDDEYVDKIDYSLDESKRRLFYESAAKYLDFIRLEDISPDTSGIRPKLQGPGEDFRDFVIKEEADAGLEGFINLIGIESPGLTACLSIARAVSRMVLRLLKTS